MTTIVIKDQSEGINLFNEDCRVFTRDTGLVGNHVTPCDVIRVYTKMNENFKGGIDNVMIKNNDFTVVITSGALTMDIGHWRTRWCVANRSGRRGGSDI